MRFVGSITATAVSQMLLNCLAGNRIQFAIQITIHQFYSFFALHFISPYQCESPNIPSAWLAREQVATSRYLTESARYRRFLCRRDLPGVARSRSPEIPRQDIDCFFN